MGGTDCGSQSRRVRFLDAEVSVRNRTVLLVTLLLFLGYAKSYAQQSPDPTQVRLNTKARLDSLNSVDVEALTTEAQAGNAEAQYGLGLVYRQGKQVPKDEDQAARWLKKSAEQGYALAQRDFGLMVVHQTPVQGEQWLRRAAERGDAEAQLWLGVGYEQSWFGNNDPQEALKWTKKAAEQEQPDAQCVLGQKYEDGDGVEQNYALAAKWYRKAADHAPNLGGAGQARNRLGQLYLKGEGVDKNYVQAYLWLYVGGVVDLTDVAAQMTPAQIAEAKEKVKEWKSLHPKDHSSPPLS